MAGMLGGQGPIWERAESNVIICRGAQARGDAIAATGKMLRVAIWQNVSDSPTNDLISSHCCLMSI